MFNEIMQLFREFEKYDKAKEKFCKEQRFIEFLNQRRNMIDSITQSVIDNSNEAIKASVGKPLNDDTRQTINKAVTWYFK